MIKKGYFFLIFFPLPLIAADLGVLSMSNGSSARNRCADNVSNGSFVCRESPLRQELYCYRKKTTNGDHVTLSGFTVLKCKTFVSKEEK